VTLFHTFAVLLLLGFGCLLVFLFSEIDARVVESQTDEILGPVSGNEYDLLLSRLAGARNNRVFHFFRIEAPQHMAEAKVAVQKQAKDAAARGGSKTTIILEKRKKQRGSEAGPKC
jgi:hypothetical protein